MRISDWSSDVCSSDLRPADLIGEVDMAGRVHQVELIGLAALRGVAEANGLRLDGDAALPLDVHRVEHLLLHLARRQAAALLDQPVGEGRLAVVDMRDDGEVADMRSEEHTSELQSLMRISYAVFCLKKKNK